MSDGNYEATMGERRGPIAEGAKAQEPTPLTPREEAIAEMRKRHGGQGRTSEDLFALELGRVLQLLQGVKEWRDKESNDGFPHELRAEIEQELINDARRVKGIVDRCGLSALPGWYAKDLSVGGYPSIVYKQPGSNKVHSYDEMVAAVKGAENAPSFEEREEAKKQLAKEFNILWGDYFPRGLIDERVVNNRRAKQVAELSAQLAALTQEHDGIKAKLVAAEVRQINSTLDRIEKQGVIEKCSDCRHYWERRGRCTKAVDPKDPRENGPGRPWSEPSTCAPPWCPGFEPHQFPSEIDSNFPPGERTLCMNQKRTGFWTSAPCTFETKHDGKHSHEMTATEKAEPKGTETINTATGVYETTPTSYPYGQPPVPEIGPRWTNAASPGRFMLIGHFTLEQAQLIHALKLDCDHRLFGHFGDDPTPEFRAGHSGGYVCTECMRAYWDGSPEVEAYKTRTAPSVDATEDDDAE